MHVMHVDNSELRQGYAIPQGISRWSITGIGLLLDTEKARVERGYSHDYTSSVKDLRRYAPRDTGRVREAGYTHQIQETSYTLP